VGQIACYRGHVLNFEDLIIRQHILNLMCNLETSWEQVLLTLLKFRNTYSAEMKLDGLVVLSKDGIKVTSWKAPCTQHLYGF
jgi:oxygen-independent coproporphyrinogen-3 oxidase